MQPDQPQMFPATLFQLASGYQTTAAVKAAVEIGLFGAIRNGATAEEIAAATGASDRGVRALANYLATIALIEKSGDRYRLPDATARYLDPQSPECIMGAVLFLAARETLESWLTLTETVRTGVPAVSERHDTPDAQRWVAFARYMEPIARLGAGLVVDHVPLAADRPVQVLDVAASHGQYGIAFAKRYPKANVTGLDWPAVAALANSSADAAGVGDRYSVIEGSAFEVDLGGPYDLILLPNFLHHFSRRECTGFLERAAKALGPGGTVAIVEFVPNEDRIGPPGQAGFALVMLAMTPDGDAYTYAEYREMLTAAGLATSELIPLGPGRQTLITARA